MYFMPCSAIVDGMAVMAAFCSNPATICGAIMSLLSFEQLNRRLSARPGPNEIGFCPNPMWDDYRHRRDPLAVPLSPRSLPCNSGCSAALYLDAGLVLDHQRALPVASPAAISRDAWL